MADDRTYVWVFNGPRASFPGGVFTTREVAERHIAEHGLSGTLTRYPLDCFVLDWAIEQGFVEPKEGRDRGRFTSAHQEHYHYEDGLGG